ncbi:WD repeat-containing protein 92 [Nymphon striatum]|nr:WD repeat-containing protein 92 [Nymphon striatum]
MDDPQIISHIEKSVDYSLYDVKWMPCSAKFVSIGCRPNGSGIIQLYELSQNGVELLSECERGFSAMNGLKTQYRTSLNQNSLSHLMRVKVDGPSVKDFNPTDSLVNSGKSTKHLKGHKLSGKRNPRPGPAVLADTSSFDGSHNHCKAIKCGTFGASSLQDRCLATGDFDGRLNIWDLENSSKYVYSAKDHKGIINCIDGVGGAGIGVGAPEIATGGHDGSVKIWDTRQKEKPVVNILPQEGNVTRDCWAVAFGNSFSMAERCICSGYDNGDIKMFDLRTMGIKWESNISNGLPLWTDTSVTQLAKKLRQSDIISQSNFLASCVTVAHLSTMAAPTETPFNGTVDVSLSNYIMLKVLSLHS